MKLHNSTRSALPDRSILIAFLKFVAVSGSASVAIRVTYTELAPLCVATSRFVIGALAFWIMALFKGIPFPKGRALAFILIGWGLVATPASRYPILMATVPLLTIFLSALHGVESIHLRGVLGSLLAVGGIVFTVGGGTTSRLSLPHIAAILLAAAFIAEGGVLIKKFPPNPPIMTNAIGMTIGGFILGVTSLVSGEKGTIPTQTSTVIALLYLIIFVTIVAFLLYMFVLGKWSASGTSYGFVLLPLVTIVVAATLAGEKITWEFLIGAGMVLAGVLIGALLPSKTNPATLEEFKDRSGQVLPHCV